eukprot:5248194-Amphidinium_carterae.3
MIPPKSLAMYTLPICSSAFIIKVIHGFTSACENFKQNPWPQSTKLNVFASSQKADADTTSFVDTSGSSAQTFDSSSTSGYIQANPLNLPSSARETKTQRVCWKGKDKATS